MLIHQTQNARILLEHGADPNSRITNGKTALHICVPYTSRDSEILRVLLEHGAKTKLKGANGRIPFVQACEEGAKSAAYLLLQKGFGDGPIRFIRKRSRK